MNIEKHQNFDSRKNPVSDRSSLCVPGMARVYFEYRNIHRLSKGCKSLMGELAKPISKLQGCSG